MGRGYYENGAVPGAGYRNGYRRGRLRTAEGPIEYGVPPRWPIAPSRSSRACAPAWPAGPPSNFGVGIGLTRSTDPVLVKLILGYRF